MTIAIIRFGGSNCDRDAEQALSQLGFNADIVWFEDGLPDNVRGVLFPGGFAYGDYLRAGAMAARTPIIEAVEAAAADGVPVLGVCNGAQICCEAGLVPGTFTVNDRARFQCERVTVRVERADTPWTSAYEEGAVIELPIAHGEGRYEAEPDVLKTLESEGRVLFRYCDEAGRTNDAANPNGSKHNIAGVLGEHGNVAVLMPHPERASLPDVGRTDGQGILTGFHPATA